MLPLRAHVHNGHLVLDEPTELPEGEVIDLVPLDEVLDGGGDYLDAMDRDRLHESIDRGLADIKNGRTVNARQVIERLKERAASR